MSGREDALDPRVLRALRIALDERRGFLLLPLAAHARKPADQRAIRHAAHLGELGVRQALGLLAVEEGLVLGARSADVLHPRDRPDPARVVQVGFMRRLRV